MYGSHRNSFNSRRSSWADSESEDDVITPCAPDDGLSMECHPATSPLIPQTTMAATRTTKTTRGAHNNRSRSDTATSAHSSVDQDRALWECMLQLQRQYGCYNSARMQAALSLEKTGLEIAMPSRACLDMLNDSIENLPDQGWEKLRKHGASKHECTVRKGPWKFWRR